MSGGEKKKKATRSQGWEEAGSEFYQESYPGEHDLDVLQRDPKQLATLLPSKQTRVVAATIRMRTNDTRTNRSTVRRHTASRSRRDSTLHRRASVAGDVQVSILPDLSEMKATEQTAWEEIMRIKMLPIPMSQKREMRMKILNEPNLRLQGYEQFKWKRRKIWRRLQSKIKESYQNVELWKGSMKRIEGIFGTGVVTFFLFLKWLFLLNLFIFSIIFIFLTLPTLLLDANEHPCEEIDNTTTVCCAQEYFNKSSGDNFIILDLVQGTGILERTVLYYGYYSNSIFHYLANATNMYYNIPLAYLLLTLLYFIVSLVSIVKGAALGFQERLLQGEGQFYEYCNLVFSSWDFCIHSEKAAKIKQRAIYREMKINLETEKREEERQSRTRDEKYKIFFVRFLVNTIVLTILVLCGCGIYFMFDISSGQLKNEDLTEAEELFFEFLPSMTMVFLNMVVPFTFRFLTTFENYSPIIVIWLILIRTVFLRLSSLIVLYFSVYSKITCNKETSENECINQECNVPECWETYVGQQLYKLLLTDFATHIVTTLIVNFLRSFIANHVENKFIKLLGEQTFDVPKHVLDVIYTQTLCWIGIFYAPLLSALASLLFFFLFYIKKFACLVNSKPSTIIYRTSRSNAMFMLVLLVSYIVAIIPIAFSITELVPSKSCGPFRGKESVWTLIVQTFLEAPVWIQSIVFFLGTAGFAIPVFIILVLLLYYYTAVNSANRHMVAVLKNQLVLEGHDKQFLLNRLGQFIKHENQKRQRLAEQMREGDKNYSS